MLAHTSSCNLHLFIDLSEISTQLLSSQKSELEVSTDHSYTHVVLSQLGLLGACLEGLDAVTGEVLPRLSGKTLEVLFKVSLG